MTTEARKAYEHNTPCSEMLIRREIGRAKRGIKYSKLWLSRYKGALRSDHTFTSKDVEYVEKCISRCLKTIKGYKRLIQTLKNGLPQRRPKGVLAKCPFCGEKHALVCSCVTDKTRNLTGYRVICGACAGSSILRDTQQQAIDAWNRRA